MHYYKLSNYVAAFGPDGPGNVTSRPQEQPVKRQYLPSETHRQSNRLPLPPRPSASLECLIDRLDRIYSLLRKRNFSDSAALSGCDAALDAGMKALATGQAGRMSARRRAGWLWTLAKRAALKAAKKEIPLVSLKLEPEDYRCAGDEEKYDGSIAVQQAVDRLPDRQRMAVTLCVLQGLTREQAAREMGIKTATVCRRLNAAFARLRKDPAVQREFRVSRRNSSPGASAGASLG